MEAAACRIEGTSLCSCVRVSCHPKFGCFSPCSLNAAVGYSVLPVQEWIFFSIWIPSTKDTQYKGYPVQEWISFVLEARCQEGERRPDDIAQTFVSTTMLFSFNQTSQKPVQECKEPL